MGFIHHKLDPRTSALRSLPGFDHLADRDLGVVASIFDEGEVPAGAKLTSEGASADHCYLVIDGEADVAIAGDVVATVGPGEFIGEMALICGGPRSATVTARTPMRVFVAHKSAFYSLLDQNAVVGHLLADMTDRLQRAQRRTPKLAT